MPTSHRRWSPFAAWARSRRPRRLSAAQRARHEEIQRHADTLARACAARNKCEVLVANKKVSAILELALCRAGELEILVRQLVLASQPCWDRPRGRRSHDKQPPVMFVPVLPPAPEPKRRRRCRPVA
jgi:hypothetical protein